MLIYWEFMNKAGVEFHFVPWFLFSIAENGLFIKHEERRDYFLSLLKNVDYQKNRLKSFIIQIINKKKKHEK